MSTSLNRSEVFHASIEAPPASVVAFITDVAKWHSWAPWVKSATRSSTREWSLETDAGAMQIRFVEPNALGVLDHSVTLESGVIVGNSMRVIQNGEGSELVMVIFQQSTQSTDDFVRDIEAVRADFDRIPGAVEASVH